MRHVEEHALELYVLGDPAVSRQKRSIAAHLERCAGCREIADRISAFYREIAHEGAPDSIHHGEDAAIPTLLDRRLSHLWGFTSAPLALTRVPRVMAFVRRHPFVAASGSVGTLAAAAVLVLLAVRPLTRSTMPETAHINPTLDVLEVRNGGREVLWNVPGVNLDTYSKEEYADQLTRNQVADIDGDGRKEMVSILPLVAGRKPGAPILRIFNADGELTHEADFDREFGYRGRNYGRTFGGNRLWISAVRGDAGAEIYAYAAGYRSPSYLGRYSSDGRPMGEYWHHGWFGGGGLVRMGSDSSEYLILYGENDEADSVNGEFSAVVMLEPHKVEGIRESSTTRGYGHPTAACEAFYVRLPTTDIQRAIGGRSSVASMKRYAGGTIGFWCQIMKDDQPAAGFEYVFSDAFEPLEVKSVSSTAVLFDRLKAEGRIAGVFDAAYLDQLRKGVRFWDGGSWRKHPVRIQPPSGGPL